MVPVRRRLRWRFDVSTKSPSLYASEQAPRAYYQPSHPIFTIDPVAPKRKEFVVDLSKKHQVTATAAHRNARRTMPLKYPWRYHAACAVRLADSNGVFKDKTDHHGTMAQSLNDITELLQEDISNRRALVTTKHSLQSLRWPRSA